MGPARQFSGMHRVPRLFPQSRGSGPRKPSERHYNPPGAGAAISRRAVGQEEGALRTGAATGRGAHLRSPVEPAPGGGAQEQSPAPLSGRPGENRREAAGAAPVGSRRDSPASRKDSGPLSQDGRGVRYRAEGLEIG